jgi:argininosuccinate lyase
MTKRNTLVGEIDEAVLAYTVGDDPALDLRLLEADCIGTAAHVTMLASLPLDPPLLRGPERDRVVGALVGILRAGRAGKVTITASDQDVHMAVERLLTARLGALGKRVHTARSRNDQVAVDLRLFAKDALHALIADVSALARRLVLFARRHADWPMVGRTHLQPGMPGSVGLWASACAEDLLEDTALLRGAYALNDRCPLGAAAGYGVPLPIDRRLTARLLGFAEPVTNVLHAVQSRGKVEAAILAALVQTMLSLSRLAEDLIIFSMPEFGYFRIPGQLCTGSSIMPQKRNPDVLELVRARCARVAAQHAAVVGVMHGLPGGYNRDLQETKAPLLEGLRTTHASVAVMARLVGALKADRRALLAGFRPEVFAADRALALAAEGMPFRDAYRHVRAHLDDLAAADPEEAIARKTHLGAPACLGLDELDGRLREVKGFASRARRRYYAAVGRLLGVKYPALTGGSES